MVIYHISSILLVSVAVLGRFIVADLNLNNIDGVVFLDDSDVDNRTYCFSVTCRTVLYILDVVRGSHTVSCLVG